MAATRPLLAAFTLAALPALAGSFGSGSKLTGNGSVDASAQGFSVALSSDGDTALVGAPFDDADTGAAFVYVRNAGAWRQQGAKLVGTGAVGAARQGSFVALSSDGDTALIGGPNDGGDVGAAWVFTRFHGAWTQQGAKLVGTGATGTASQGLSVALSADGDTAAVGGALDASSTGAVWVFKRIAGVWSQQGGKLVGTGGGAGSQEGASVALSADGNTLVAGGPKDDAGVGAVWVFTRSAGTWSQQGAKLVGTGATGTASQGGSVAVSADGDTAAAGGSTDDSSTGATWVFTRSAGVWSQQGAKLVGTGGIGTSKQGAVGISSDGNTLVTGGQGDNSNLGAGWVFARSSGVWSQQGAKLIGTGNAGVANEGARMKISGDGNTILMGGYTDNGGIGAAWAFQRTCVGGDVNGDGLVTVTDVFYTINYLFAGGAAPACY